MSADTDIATKRLRLKIALEELREMKGFGTELVTIIIPPDRQIWTLELCFKMSMDKLLISNQKAQEKMFKVPLNQQYRRLIVSKLQVKMG